MRTKISLLITLSILIAPTCFARPALNGQSIDEKIVMLTILAEARGEGLVGMYAVACVIQQRVVERKLSAAKVCTQRLQFSCWNGQRIYDVEKISRKTAPSVREYARDLAKIVVSKGNTIDRSKVGFANHYCVVSINPKWSVGVKPVAVVKQHKFYRL